ncbi:MAG: HPF/RaiA family ribosome-associated protein [Patescibacteria group bacterium]|jgi:ribosomal subunit interface protein
MQFTSWNHDGYEPSEQDRELIIEKISKLERFDARLADESTTVHVEIVRGKKHASPNFGLRVQITIPGGALRAEASGKTVAEATDEVERKLRAQVEKMKD